MPSPSEYAVSNPTSPPVDPRGLAAATPSARPHGPRDMASLPKGPPRPAKIPIDTTVAAGLPKPPSPTYSPARNMPTPASINPPRSTARSMVGTGGRTNSIPSHGPPSPPGSANGHVRPNLSKPTNGRAPDVPPRRKSVYLPRETGISAEKLYDYLRLHHILLIDVRSREDFDQGHVYTSSIMCIEPTALRRGMSAEELQDALVLSPESEQIIFDRRDQYDLVVYYDQSTSSTSYLHQHDPSGSEHALRVVYDALYEFNQEKPLQRPPILLQGGLEAWADLVGTSALILSNTAAKVSLSRANKATRPVGIVLNANRTSSSYTQRRRLRDYNPLEPEEEQRWLERAKAEGIEVDRRPGMNDDGG